MSRYALRCAALEEEKGAADSAGADRGFFLGGVHHYFNTNKPHFLYYKAAGYLKGGGGVAHPLHPLPRSALAQH